MANIFRQQPTGRLGSVSAFVCFSKDCPSDEIANEFWEAPTSQGISTKVNIGGIFKTVAARYVNIGGVWKQVTSMSVKIGGAWKLEV